MYKIIFFVPKSHLENVKEAMFNAGAGKSDHYSHCSWQTEGTMSYKAEAGSNPAKGEKGEYITSTEYRVEMVCKSQYLTQVVAALKQAHPYEVPPFELFKLETDPTVAKNK